LQGVTKARAEALQAASPEIRLSAEQNLTQNINALIGMAERIPNSRPRRISATCDGNSSTREPCHRLAPLLQSGGRRIWHDVAPVPRQHYRPPVQDERADAVRSRIERVLIDEPLAVKF